MKQTFFAVAMAFVALSAQAHGSKAHVHGHASMQVAVEGKEIIIDWQSPMDSVVGFEHAPRNEKQRQAIQAVEDQFRSPGKMFIPTADAKCTAQPAEVKLPFKSGGASAEDKRDKEVHSDLEAAIRFECENPAALKGMELKLFDAFSRLQRVDVQAIGPRGQSAARLTPKQRLLQW